MLFRSVIPIHERLASDIAINSSENMMYWDNVSLWTVLKASSYEEGATMRQRNAQIGGHNAGGSAGGSDGKLQK